MVDISKMVVREIKINNKELNLIILLLLLRLFVYFSA
jgi:hypothetical protein